MRDLVDKIAKKGVTTDELARVKAQQSAALQGWKTDNTFWLKNVLADAQERPSRLTDIRGAENAIAQTSLADLNALARKYLRSEHVLPYIIQPSARFPKGK